MLRKSVVVGIVGLALAMAASPKPALAIGPVSQEATFLQMDRGFLEVSFWGRPFPYGYTGWGPCIRYVPVETPWGTRWRRVRVCR